MIDPQASVMLNQSLHHLDLIRSKPCAVKGPDCRGDVVAAHLVNVGQGSTRKRPSLRHYSTVPLCTGHHQEQEGNTLQFGIDHNVDLSLYALQLTIESLTGVEACWHNDKGKL